MGAKKKAKKQFAKEAELAELRAKKKAKKQFAKEAELAELRASSLASDAKPSQFPELSSKNRNGWAKKLVLAGVFSLVAMVVVLAIVATFGSTSGGANSPSGSGTRTYPASIDGSFVVNPATLAIQWSVQNNGSQTVKPSCVIEAKDLSGTYRGFDTIETTNPIPAGSTVHATSNLTITKEGANFATDISITCTAQTSDKTVTTGKSVTVVSVSNPLGAFDSSSGWYWGGTPIVSGVAVNTQMTCIESAFDASGKVIATHRFSGVTLNNNAVTGYGDGQDPTVDATKAIAQAITSVTAKCTLS